MNNWTDLKARRSVSPQKFNGGKIKLGKCRSSAGKGPWPTNRSNGETSIRNPNGWKAADLWSGPFWGWFWRLSRERRIWAGWCCCWWSWPSAPTWRTADTNTRVTLDQITVSISHTERSHVKGICTIKLTQTCWFPAGGRMCAGYSGRGFR